MILGSRLAEAIVLAVVARDKAVGVAVSVAVCGEGGRVIAFLKMDGTDALSGYEATRCAITASGAGTPSEQATAHDGSATSTAHEGLGLSRQPRAAPHPGNPVPRGDRRLRRDERAGRRMRPPQGPLRASARGRGSRKETPGGVSKHRTIAVQYHRRQSGRGNSEDLEPVPTPMEYGHRFRVGLRRPGMTKVAACPRPTKPTRSRR